MICHRRTPWIRRPWTRTTPSCSSRDSRPLALIQALAGKLQAAAAAGDTNAREWMLDLKEVALGVQQEEGQVSLLLQSIHSMVDNHVQSNGQPGYQQQGYQQPQPGYQQQGYQPQPGYQQGYQQQGG